MSSKISWEGSLIPMHYNQKNGFRDTETRKKEMEKNFNSDMNFFFDFRGGRHDALLYLSKISPLDNTTPVYSSLGINLDDWVKNRFIEAMEDGDFDNAVIINETSLEPHMRILVNSEPCSFFDLPSETQVEIAKDMLENGLFRGKLDYDGKIEIPEMEPVDKRGYGFAGSELTVKYDIDFKFEETARGKKSESEYNYSINQDKMSYEEYNKTYSHHIDLNCLSVARKEELKIRLKEENCVDIYNICSDLFTSASINVYDKTGEEIDWEDLSKNVKSSILDKVFEQEDRENTITFTLEITEPEKEILSDLAVTDIGPDKYDPDYLTGVLWVGEKDFDFDYNKNTGDIEFHNYDYDKRTYSGYKELDLPSYFEEPEILEIFQEEVDMACTSYLIKETSLDEMLKKADAKSAASISSLGKSREEMEL